MSQSRTNPGKKAAAAKKRAAKKPAPAPDQPQAPVGEISHTEVVNWLTTNNPEAVAEAIKAVAEGKTKLRDLMAQ